MMCNFGYSSTDAWVYEGKSVIIKREITSKCLNLNVLFGYVRGPLLNIWKIAAAPQVGGNIYAITHVPKEMSQGKDDCLLERSTIQT